MKPILVALALPVICAALPVQAEVPVDTVGIEKKTKFVEIDVAYPKTGVATIDTELADWATGMVEDFEKGAAEDFSSFEKDNGELPPWAYSLDMGFETARNDDAMLVFDFDQSTFLGGAHPNHDIMTFNYLMPDAWEVYLPEIFDGRKALDRISALTIAQLEKDVGGPDGMSDSDWIKGGAGANWSNFQDFLLLEDKLVIRFPPYQVAAYAAGPQQVEIPLSELDGLMRKDWRAPVASFDCAKAASATEKAICSDVALGRLDRTLSDTYTQVVAFAGEEADKTKIRDAQRQWIVERDACGGDVACLTAQYDERLKVLRAAQP